MYLMAQEMGQQFAEDDAAERMVLADLLRRAGLFDDAKEVVEELSRFETRVAQQVAALQLELIERGDSFCYRLEDAERYCKKQKKWYRHFGKSAEARTVRKKRLLVKLLVPLIGLALMLTFDHPIIAGIGFAAASLGLIALAYTPRWMRPIKIREDEE
jgi:hypothetical protein